MQGILYYYLIFINCTAFIVYGADKAFAKLHSWRVPEIVLLLLAALGGSAGAFIAIQLYHHKTQHLSSSSAYRSSSSCRWHSSAIFSIRAERSLKTVQNRTTPCCMRLWGCTVLFVVYGIWLSRSSLDLLQ